MFYRHCKGEMYVVLGRVSRQIIGGPAREAYVYRNVLGATVLTRDVAEFDLEVSPEVKRFTPVSEEVVQAWFDAKYPDKPGVWNQVLACAKWQVEDFSRIISVTQFLSESVKDSLTL